jgi:hypothetical protein
MPLNYLLRGVCAVTLFAALGQAATASEVMPEAPGLNIETVIESATEQPLEASATYVQLVDPVLVTATLPPRRPVALGETGAARQGSAQRPHAIRVAQANPPRPVASPVSTKPVLFWMSVGHGF